MPLPTVHIRLLYPINHSDLILAQMKFIIADSERKAATLDAMYDAAAEASKEGMALEQGMELAEAGMLLGR